MEDPFKKTENRTNSSPKEIKKLQEQEKNDAELLADYLKRHPKPVILPENSKEAELKITALETMITAFEATHSLKELHEITDLSPDLAMLFKYADDLASSQRIEDAIKTYEKYNPQYVEVYKKKIACLKDLVLTPEDARKFKIRIAAKKDLIPIIAALNTLGNNHPLKEKCSKLMKAVGGIQGEKVNHE